MKVYLIIRLDKRITRTVDAYVSLEDAKQCVQDMSAGRVTGWHEEGDRIYGIMGGGGIWSTEDGDPCLMLSSAHIETLEVKQSSAVKENEHATTD